MSYLDSLSNMTYNTKFFHSPLARFFSLTYFFRAITIFTTCIFMFSQTIFEILTTRVQLKWRSHWLILAFYWIFYTFVNCVYTLTVQPVYAFLRWDNWSTIIELVIIQLLNVAMATGLFLCFVIIRDKLLCRHTRSK